MKNLRGKKDIIIDLTSLLDVIFIVLMVVLFGRTAQSAERPVSAEEFDQSAQVSHDEKYENMDKYVLFIDVKTSYIVPEKGGENKDHSRYLQVVSGIGEDKKVLVSENAGDEDMRTINDVNEAEVYEKLKTYIEEIIKGALQTDENGDSTGALVVLSLNRDDGLMLYRDEYNIRKIFDELTEEYKDSVFYR